MAVTRKQKSSEHMCSICEVARANPLNKQVQMNKHTSSKRSKTRQKLNILKICAKCLSGVKRGKPHVCTKKKKIENLAKIAGNDADKLLSSSLQSRVTSTNDVVLKNIRGKGTKVKVMKSKTKAVNKGSLSHNNILKIKNVLDLSTRKVINYIYSV